MIHFFLASFLGLLSLAYTHGIMIEPYTYN